MSRNGRPVSDAELEVLKVLWDRGPGTVRAVEAQLRRGRRRWAYNTVLTLLSRLRGKKYVAADKGSDAALVFRATVTRDDLLRHGLSDLAERMCDGTSTPLVHALVKGRNLSPEDISSLRQLLDQLEQND